MHTDRIGPDRGVEIIQQTLTGCWSRLLLANGRLGHRRDLLPVAHDIAVAARDDGLLPEQLIVAIKESWRSDYEPQLGDDRLRKECVLTELISLSIQEYFRSFRPDD